MKTKKYEKLDLVTAYLKDDGTFPNHDTLPVLLYRSVLILPFFRAATSAEKFFRTHDWSNGWRGTVYDYHHYHSNTHELMAVMRGEADLQLGGSNGIVLTVKKGDVLIIPAGVAHKRIKSDTAFRILGVYPAGRDYDMNTGKKGERPEADRRIQEVPLPKQDPVFGDSGPMKDFWKRKAGAK